MKVDEVVLKILLDVGTKGDRGISSAAKRIADYFGSFSKFRAIAPAVKERVRTVYEAQRELNKELPDFSTAWSKATGTVNETAKKLKANVELVKFIKEKQLKQEMEILKVQRQQELARIKELQRKRALVPIYFSILFLGLRVSRALNSFVSRSFKVYSEVVGNVSRTTNALHRIQAAAYYTAFVIMDSLARSEFFMKLAEFVANLMQAFGEFVSANPTLAISILVGGVLITAISVLASWVAQIELLVIYLKQAKALGIIKTTFDLFVGALLLPAWLLNAIKTGVIAIAVYFTLKLAFDVGYNFGKAIGEKARILVNTFKKKFADYLIEGSDSLFEGFIKRFLAFFAIIFNSFTIILLRIGQALAFIFGRMDQAKEISAAINSTKKEIEALWSYVKTGDTSKLKEMSDLFGLIAGTSKKEINFSSFGDALKNTVPYAREINNVFFSATNVMNTVASATTNYKSSIDGLNSSVSNLNYNLVKLNYNLRNVGLSSDVTKTAISKTFVYSPFG